MQNHVCVNILMGLYTRVGRAYITYIRGGFYSEFYHLCFVSATNMRTSKHELFTISNFLTFHDSGFFK